MANLKEVRERITSVISTQQITKAMKMVSAAKLRKAQTAITQMRPFSNKLNAMLTNILSNLDGDSSVVFNQERIVKNACVVVVTSNRGLCGAFNTNVIKSAVQAIHEKYADQKETGNLTIVCIGKKGYDYFRRAGYGTIVNTYVELFSDLSFENVAKVAGEVMGSFKKGDYDHVTICYGKFRNAATQTFDPEQFLPVSKLQVTDKKSEKKSDYIFEPNQEQLLHQLVPTILKTQFYKCVLDTHASEHGARMTAMDKATDNAQEMLKALKINYNKARQEAITRELSEIVGGAAALDS
jgi:F-type H+-transporting ATPase subunit gamma